MKILYTSFSTLLFFVCFLQAETSSIFTRKLDASNVWIRAEASSWGSGAISYWLNEIKEIDNNIISDDLEYVIVTGYKKKPSPQKALFLGMCKGKESLDLLIKSRGNLDSEIERAVNLAIARRKGSPYQESFINQFYALPACSNYYVLYMDERGRNGTIGGKGMMRELEYINTPSTVVVLMEVLIVSPDRVTQPKEGWLRIVDFPPDVARQYLKEIGIEMPAGLNQQQRIEWWSANKAAVLKRLECLKSLPEIKLPLLGFGIS